MAASKEPTLPSQEELASLSREAQVAYAARCAIRVFPLIGSEGHFNFWRDDAERHLDAIWTAALVAIEPMAAAVNDAANAANVAARGAYTAYTVADAARAAAYTADSAARVARAAANAAYTADVARVAANAAYVAANAAYAAAYAAADVAGAIRKDFEFLQKHDPEELFRQPLFPDSSDSRRIEDWLSSDIEKAFESVGRSDLLKMWSGFFYGNVSERDCVAWIHDWYERYKDENKAQSTEVEPEPKAGSKKKPAKKKTTKAEKKTKVSKADVLEDANLADWESDGGALHQEAEIEPAEEIVVEAELDEMEAESTGIGETKEPEAEEKDSSLPSMPSTGSAKTSAEVPAQVDRLNRDRMVKSIARMLAFKKQGTPITIGLFGHWGAGKSSVMQLLQKELSDSATKDDYPDFEFLFGWFNAWEYEHTNDIRSGLAQEVVNGLLSNGSYRPKEPTLSRPVSGRERFKIQRKFILSEKRKEWHRFLFKSLLTTVPIAAGIFGISADQPILGTGSLGLGLFLSFQMIKQFKLIWEHPIATELATFFKLPSYRKELGQIPVIRKQLEGLAKIRLGVPDVDENEPEKESINQRFERWQAELCGEKSEPPRRLIIFVDDLDRCHTKTIAEAFDAIRLITHIPNVIVIIGIDERIAFKAMGQAYSDYADDRIGRSQEEVARDYLGKIVQLPIRLEPPDIKGLGAFVQEKLFPKEDRAGVAEQKKDSQGDESPPLAKPNDSEEQRLKNREDQSKKIDDGAKRKSKEAVQKEPKKAEGINLVSKPDEEELRKQQEQEDAEKAELEAAHQAWLEKQREQLKITEDEVQAFSDLTDLFEFSNPRQLMRLRNTYCLLKSLYPEKEQPEAEEKAEASNRYPEAENNLMMMLFWLEYCLQSTPKQIAKWATWKPDTQSSEGIKGLFRSELLEQIDFKSSDFLFKDLMWRRLKKFTETCILPYPEKELSVEFSKED